MLITLTYILFRILEASVLGKYFLFARTIKKRNNSFKLLAASFSCLCINVGWSKWDAFQLNIKSPSTKLVATDTGTRTTTFGSRESSAALDCSDRSTTSCRSCALCSRRSSWRRRCRIAAAPAYSTGFQRSDSQNGRRWWPSSSARIRRTSNPKWFTAYAASRNSVQTWPFYKFVLEDRNEQIVRMFLISIRRIGRRLCIMTVLIKITNRLNPFSLLNVMFYSS